MNKRRGIIPNDISSSREYFGLNNSQDIYKGTSFKFSGEWTPNTHYFNDEYIIDFVTYNHKLWACSRNHLSSSDLSNAPSDKSRYWDIALDGVPGTPGLTPVVKVIDYNNEAYLCYGYDIDGVVEEWHKLCPMSELRGEKGEKGDDVCYVGDSAPSKDSNYQIWFDTSDESGTSLGSPIDILFAAYREAGGYLSEESFRLAIKNLSPISGFEVREVDSLPKNPTEDMVGYIYIIHTRSDDEDSYDEYTLVKSGTTGDKDEYKWEKISSGGGSGVDMSNYSTTQEVHQIIEDKLDNEEISSSNWS